MHRPPAPGSKPWAAKSARSRPELPAARSLWCGSIVSRKLGQADAAITADGEAVTLHKPAWLHL